MERGGGKLTAAERAARAAEVVADHSPLPPRVEAFVDELAAMMISAVGKPLPDHADKLIRLAGLVRE